ncbi:MAG: hypothetical protein ACE5I7_04305 [Candidatus Binatia bacterium]
MSTMKGNMQRMLLSGVVATVIAFGIGGAARADVTSDQAAAILIFPKIVVDTSGVLGPATDTIIQVTNASNSIVAARCFYINATSHCSNAPTTACTTEGVANLAADGQGGCPVGGTCEPSWNETDFRMTLTKRQPVSWKATDGLNVGTSPLPGTAGVLGVPEDPFFGELKCVEVDPGTFKPVSGFDPANDGRGDLKGEATIVSAVPGEFTSAVDTRKYNAIGLQAIPSNGNNGDDTLQLGGTGAEYNGCPNILTLDHLFDDAPVVTHGGGVTRSVVTELTVVPCGEDLALQVPATVTLQFLVFNEFEQRFSTSTHITCFEEIQLSNIDTRPVSSDDFASIFNVNVQGTFSGQTRIRPVSTGGVANGVLAVAEEFWDCGSGPGDICSTAANVHFVGSRDLGDQLILSPDIGGN